METIEKEGQKLGQWPWLDLRLTQKAIYYLWDIINNPVVQQTDVKNNLAGNISKSYYIQDNKDIWFYENVLKRYTETMYFNDWNNYYDVHIAKHSPHPKFRMDNFWVNYQKQHEFNPPHNHNAGFSFVVFMKIPTHWKEQHSLPICERSTLPSASDFQFILGQGTGQVTPINILLTPEDEGRMLFFPAWLAHQVFPFYGTEEERITVSGNIVNDASPNPQMQLDTIEKEIKDMQEQKVLLEDINDKRNPPQYEYV